MKTGKCQGQGQCQELVLILNRRKMGIKAAVKKANLIMSQKTKSKAVNLQAGKIYLVFQYSGTISKKQFSIVLLLYRQNEKGK